MASSFLVSSHYRHFMGKSNKKTFKNRKSNQQIQKNNLQKKNERKNTSRKQVTAFFFAFALDGAASAALATADGLIGLESALAAKTRNCEGGKRFRFYFVFLFGILVLVFYFFDFLLGGFWFWKDFPFLTEPRCFGGYPVFLTHSRERML